MQTRDRPLHNPYQESKRLLQVITLSEWGGAQRVVFETTCALHGNGFDVEVACSPSGPLVERLRASGVRVHEIPALRRDLSPIHEIQAFVALYRLIRREGYDVIHCHSTKAGIIGRLAGRLARCRLIFFTAHGWGFDNKEEYGRYQWLIILAERLAARVTDRIICTSRYAFERALALQIARRDQLEVIYTGIAWNDLPATPGTLSHQLVGDRSSLVFGMVARLAYPKDPLHFLRAAVEVIREHPHVRFLLIGAGPLSGECNQFIRDHGLQDAVKMLGFREDARRLLQELDVFVLCSRFEGLPVSIVEAMCAGLPVIATDAGGMRELIDGNGFLVPIGDTATLEDRMVYFVENPHEIQHMGARSRELAKTTFRFDHMVQALRALYEPPTSPPD